ncbi:hypothetical protein [Chryseolinea sp. H1M3-3]|uniref:hypothetical protein n=1 Tax=Chryseolinea sp. H1M3-3 TaxID=3034144 RepID=UPI0023EB0BAC|nr:hypothetical protein [Chryseolinea sp. H1M3-3]
MKTSDNNRTNGAAPVKEPPALNRGENFGGNYEIPQLPPGLEEKIELAKGLQEDITQQLKELSFGPGGEPVIPPGLPGELILKDELEKIKDIITGKYRLPAGIRIAHVELTQSTQFCNFDNLSSGAADDNSVPLVANKDLIIRVYVDKRPGMAGYVPNLVTGRVRFAGKEFTPLNGPIPPRDKTLIRRSNLNHTLNFRIPAALCHGERTFQVRAFDIAYTSPLVGIGINIDGSLMHFSSTSETFYARFRNVPHLKVCGVMINYAGPNFNLPAPLGTDLPTSLSRFLPMFPIQGFDFGPCTVTPWGDDMQIESGKKGSGWDSLINFIANLRSASTIRAIYVGLLPTNLAGQLGIGQRGIGRPGIAIAAKDDTRALSHELAHALTLLHLDDGTGAAGPYETNYPKYKEGTFPFGSIGEFGLNTSRMTLFDPANSVDLMSYGDGMDVLFPTNTWISPYHYQRMLNTIVASDGTGDIITIVAIVVIANFRVYRDGKVELLSSYIVDNVSRYDNAPITDAILLDIHGANGEVVGTHRCHRHNPYQDEENAFIDYHELIPWTKDFSGFSVIRNGKVIDTIKTEKKKSKIKLDNISRVQRNGDLMHLKWNTEAENAEQPTMIRYSNDNGKTWQAIATDVKNASHLVNLDLLPGGKECRLEVIASGLQKVSVQTEPFEVPVKPRKAFLYSPQDGETFTAGTSISFLGGGYSPDHDPCGFDEISWHSNIQGYLGAGNQMSKNDLIPGTHRIIMSMPDGAGGEVKTGVWIRVVEEGDDREAGHC